MKRKRYRSNLAKTVWVITEHVALAAALVCGVIFLELLSKGINPFVDGGRPYIQSEFFTDQVYEDAFTILRGIPQKELLASTDDGAQKVIDLWEIWEGAEITYENTSGLAYSMEDLLAWSENGWEHLENWGEVLICTKTDGSYEYIYNSDFEEKVKEELVLELDSKYWENNWKPDGYTKEEAVNKILEFLKNGEYTGETGITQDGILSVKNKKGEILYTDIRNYPGAMIKEEYAPVGAESMLDVLNTESRWNKKAGEAIEALEQALEHASGARREAQMLDTFQEGNTNLTYLYVNPDEKKLYTNRSEYERYETYANAVSQMKEQGSYILVRPKLSECETNLYLSGNENWHQGTTLRQWQHVAQGELGAEDYYFVICVDTEFPIADALADDALRYQELIKYSPAAGVGIFFLFVFFAGLIWLTVAAGRKPEDEDIHLNAFDRWYTEIAATSVFGVWLSLMAVCGRFLHFGDDEMPIIAGVMGLFTAALFLTGYLSLVRRIKARTLWSNSLLRQILKIVGCFFRKCGEILELMSRNTSGKIKILIVLGAFFVLQFVTLMCFFSGSVSISMFFFLLLAAADLCLLGYALYHADGNDRILEGLKRITEGELQYKIPTEKLKGDQKRMAEYISRIGDGLDAAVENSLKNERMKTELITNVSHDIKTPLTSIINYVDLLKKENFTDPKICGYLDILEAKAMRLKKLTEDVVEASKASTGNITLDLTDLDFGEMIHQVIGEFEEKFQEKGLVMMVDFPGEPCVIRADGQKMWRVLENIFNNVLKYAMEGTRVYAETKIEDVKISFSLKNISAQPLNIPANELTERFIRGDASRNTEGSGLGLSIAQSLTTLQGGAFQIFVDGDLFKVTIRFSRENMR